MSEAANSDSSSHHDLKTIKQFSQDAASDKTPFKAPRVSYNLNPFVPHDRDKFLKGIKTLKDGGFGMSSLEYFDRVDKQFNHVEEVFTKLIDKFNVNNDEIFTTMKMLEFEKNRIKLEVGNQKDVSLEDSFDASSV